MTIFQSVTPSGWGRSTCSTVRQWIVSTSINPTLPHAVQHITVTSLSVRTTNSVSTICVTIWPCRPAIWCSASTTMPSSMRSIQCLSMMPVHRSSSPALFRKVRIRCLMYIAPTLRRWSRLSVVSSPRFLPRPRQRSLPMTRRYARKARSCFSVPTRVCPRTVLSSNSFHRRA